MIPHRCDNPEHKDGCSGPTGVHVPSKCSSCGSATYVNTCWVKGQRKPTVTPVLCDTCGAQGVLL